MLSVTRNKIDKFAGQTGKPCQPRKSRHYLRKMVRVSGILFTFQYRPCNSLLSNPNFLYHIYHARGNHCPHLTSSQARTTTYILSVHKCASSQAAYFCKKQESREIDDRCKLPPYLRLMIDWLKMLVLIFACYSPCSYICLTWEQEQIDISWYYHRPIAAATQETVILRHVRRAIDCKEI